VGGWAAVGGWRWEGGSGGGERTLGEGGRAARAQQASPGHAAATGRGYATPAARERQRCAARVRAAPRGCRRAAGQRTAVDGARRLGAQVREVGHADADARDRREAAIGLVQPEEVEAVAAPVDMCEALGVAARQDEDARLLVRAAAQVLDQGVDAERTGGERAQQHLQPPLGVGGRFAGAGRLVALLLLLLLLLLPVGYCLRPVRKRLHLLVGQLVLQVRDKRLGIRLARVATERGAGPEFEDRLQPARTGGDAPSRTYWLVLGAVDAVQQAWVGVTELIPEGIELLLPEVELDKGRSSRTHHHAHCLRVEGDYRTVGHCGLQKEQQWVNHRHTQPSVGGRAHGTMEEEIFGFC
jgi:hypothetical protein